MSLTSLFSSMRSCVHSVSKLQAACAPFFFGLGDRDEIGADPAAVDDLVGDAFVGEPEMAGRLVERRVDDRVFDDDLTHTLSCHADRADAQAIGPDLFTGKLLFCPRFSSSQRAARESFLSPRLSQNKGPEWQLLKPATL